MSSLLSCDLVCPNMAYCKGDKSDLVCPNMAYCKGDKIRAEFRQMQTCGKPSVVEDHPSLDIKKMTRYIYSHPSNP